MQPGSSGLNVARGRMAHVAAAALYALLSLLMMQPVLAAPRRLALGHPGNDVWNHVWGYWFVGEGLMKGELPLETPLLTWPAGGALWFIDFFDVVVHVFSEGARDLYDLSGLWMDATRIPVPDRVPGDGEETSA